jgi:hypothetical protein
MFAAFWDRNLTFRSGIDIDSESDMRFRSDGIGRSATDYYSKYPNVRAWVNPFLGLRKKL